MNVVLIWWSGSCRRSRRYVWPAATSVIWGTSCSWARGFMTGSRATLPHRRSSTLTPPPPEDLTNQPSQSTSVLSASATRGKWWADDNYKSTSKKKKAKSTATKMLYIVRSLTEQCYQLLNGTMSLCDLKNYNKNLKITIRNVFSYFSNTLNRALEILYT